MRDTHYVYIYIYMPYDLVIGHDNSLNYNR